MKRVHLISFATICFFLFLTLQVFAQNGQAKYIFYFIGDGMGVNQVNGTEMYLAEKEGKIGIKPLNFTQFPVCTIVNTYSASHTVTCSAAAGTALATGHKTSKGTIGMDSSHQVPFTSIAEKALKAGKKVGIITSVSIDHATPAVFYAHQSSRKMAYEIGIDLAKSGFDFFAGAGFVSPKGKKGDLKSLFEIVRDSGYIVAKGNNEYKIKSAESEKLILFQEENKDPESLPFSIDRTANDLTLPQMTENAIDFLSKGNQKGFFLMAEGGKIDWACHGNDAATAFGEVVDLSEAIQYALDFYNKHPQETLIIVTADHETGGIILSTKDYSTNLKVLEQQKHSQEYVTSLLKELNNSKTNIEWEDVQGILKENFGFWDKIELTNEQEDRLKRAYINSYIQHNAGTEKSLYSENAAIAALAKEIINEIALIGWGSDVHTAGFVPLYAIGVGAEKFSGQMDNTKIPQLIEQIGGY